MNCSRLEVLGEEEEGKMVSTSGQGAGNLDRVTHSWGPPLLLPQLRWTPTEAAGCLSEAGGNLDPTRAAREIEKIIHKCSSDDPAPVQRMTGVLLRGGL